ncbi:hypothetical protein GFL49_26975 [Rhizobium leguminosarum bv. viciae]|nr:hypothetical protein [Rhizobium leguminosarum bv. viciae]
MPDVPALFNSACCCAVRMPIPHGVFLSQFTQFRQNRFVHCLEVLRSFVYAIPDGKPLHTFPGIALAVQICRSFTYMQS